MHKLIILGAGRVGHVIARDLNDDSNIQVTIADRRTEYLDALCKKLECETVCADLSDIGAIERLASDHDLVIGALPGAMGLNALKGVVATGKPCVDISFMPEDPSGLDKEARRTGSRVLYDFGVAPGMSNLLAATAAMEVAPARQIRIVVGGLPMVRRQPWEYSAPFSPADVLEEYTRPARIKVSGKMVERVPLSGVELVEFPEVGTLEAFFTDGLRSLLQTIDCPGMEEKTLRYPGYAKKIGLLRDSGFLRSVPIEVNGVEIAPIDLTLKLLEPAWHLDDMMEEFTVMRITATGGNRHPFTRVTWDLFDRTDRDRNETSMARTTGFPAAIVARRMLDGTIDLEPGIHPPEALAGNTAFVESILNDLNARKVVYRKTVT